LSPSSLLGAFAYCSLGSSDCSFDTWAVYIACFKSFAVGRVVDSFGLAEKIAGCTMLASIDS
jgi:hypothetical protein